MSSCVFPLKNFPVVPSLVPSSMEERIAELNRQSLEARSKLLQLLEQQKLVGLSLSSSPVSPAQAPLRAWAGGSHIQFSLSTAEAHTESKEGYPSILCSSTPSFVPEKLAWVRD